MKKLLLAFGLLLGLGPLALAQNPFSANVTTSLQGSQFGNGPVGIDTSSNMYFPDHINALGNKGVAPTATPCGVTAAVVTSASTDNAALITTGTTATTCTILFGSAFVNIPICQLSGEGTATFPTYTTTTSGLNVSIDIASTKYRMLCIGNF